MNATPSRPDSFTLHMRARAHRSRLIGTMLARLLCAIARIPEAARLTAGKRHAILDAKART